MRLSKGAVLVIRGGEMARFDFRLQRFGKRILFDNHCRHGVAFKFMR